MYNAAFRELNLDCTYVAFRVQRGMLADAIAGIRALGIAGLNVTHPHKVGILQLLDKLDRLASQVGAVNTVKNEEGELIGYNTDGVGAIRALKQEAGKLKDRRIVLIGAGGAARAIAFKLIDEGAKLVIANRTVERAQKLAEDIKAKRGVFVGTVGLKPSALEPVITKAEILINATSVGMYPDIKKTVVTAKMLHPNLLVNDIVYQPLQTRLLREAEKVGARTLSGLEMLVQQGAASFEILTGKKAPIEVMRKAAERELRKRGESS
jgi:shikimate dehydrogenase